MITANIVVTYNDDSTTEVLIKPSAMVKFERKYNKSMKEVDARTEYTLFLVYSQLEINGESVPPFDNWIRTIKDVVAERRGDPTTAQQEGVL